VDTPTDAPKVGVVAEPPQQETADSGKRPMDRESRLLAWINGISTLVMAFFTGVLVKITRQQKVLTDVALGTTRAIERAYVAMSHLDVGLLPATDYGLPLGFPIDASIEVKNHGQTPATILETGLELRIGERLASPPTYAPDKCLREQFVLVPGGKAFCYLRDFGLFRISEPAELTAVRDGTKHVWLVGYLIYEDIFKKRHRAGYARHYKFNPMVSSNLELDRSTNEYNYYRDE
jgi:hypothetical protein